MQKFSAALCFIAVCCAGSKPVLIGDKVERTIYISQFVNYAIKKVVTKSGKIGRHQVMTLPHKAKLPVDRAKAIRIDIALLVALTLAPLLSRILPPIRDDFLRDLKFHSVRVVVPRQNLRSSGLCNRIVRNISRKKSELKESKRIESLSIEY